MGLNTCQIVVGYYSTLREVDLLTYFCIKVQVQLHFASNLFRNSGCYQFVHKYCF